MTERTLTLTLAGTLLSATAGTAKPGLPDAVMYKNFGSACCDGHEALRDAGSR